MRLRCIAESVIVALDALGRLALRWVVTAEESTRDTCDVFKGSLAVVVAALATAMAPAGAFARPDDAAATRSYIDAHYALLRAAQAALPVERTAAAKLVGETRSECPGVAAGSPRDEESAALGTEALVVVSDTLLAKNRAAIKRFAGAVENLRWSNATLTRLVRRYAAKLRVELTLKAPDLCADLKAWAASGFQTVPAGVTRTNQETEADSTGPEEVPLRLLKPYVRRNDDSILHRSKRLEVKLRGAPLKTGLKAWSEILSIVGLST